MQRQLNQSDLSLALISGLLYLVIIICGIGAEVALRGPLVDLSSASATAVAVRAAGLTLPLAIIADVIMAVADAALAITLFVLFRSVAPILALAAMVFRLIQSVLIAANLLNMQVAWLLITGGQDSVGLGGAETEALALAYLNLHAHGYDLGLIFFAINSFLTGLLIWNSGMFPKIIGGGIIAAGAVYLAGSGMRFLAPDMFVVFAPAYGLPVLAELAFCVSLLMSGSIWRRRQIFAAI
ncbi:DUF4386 domain-containing protein [Yoonia sediminilitoris]|uniref:Uncharacterized protein DUF4386 n=1 Tax=Yoonia sediminilitoris TaxID=1286148 RepID=A0A2T6KKB5_9RHOB|nr:DUF4386 domain-containing protein [Yoonia sediminilitoris]PUB16410.1 uncharacterized protein DUF4386 [Yoonia sediminilitoris]RCW96759.1 uncharacterized protein DUF4386 [Yoonia sediminilitoris]